MFSLWLSVILFVSFLSHLVVSNWNFTRNEWMWETLLDIKPADGFDCQGLFKLGPTDWWEIGSSQHRSSSRGSLQPLLGGGCDFAVGFWSLSDIRESLYPHAAEDEQTDWSRYSSDVCHMGEITGLARGWAKQWDHHLIWIAVLIFRQKCFSLGNDALRWLHITAWCMHDKVPVVCTLN